MLSLPMLWTFLRKVPGIAWVILFAAAVAVAGFVAAVHLGERTVQRAAVADSVVHVQAKRDSIRATSDSLGRLATKAKTVSDTGRAHARAVLAAHLEDTPPEVVHTMSAQLTSDSLTIHAQAMETASLRAERPVGDSLDRLRVSQVAIGAPAPNHHTTAKVVGAVVTTVVVVLSIIHFTK